LVLASCGCRRSLFNAVLRHTPVKQRHNRMGELRPEALQTLITQVGQALQAQTIQGFRELEERLETRLTREEHLGQGAQGNRQMDYGCQLDQHQRQLAETLDDLIETKRLPTRDLYEVKILLSILRERDPEQARGIIVERLETLYIANMRSWAQAQAYSRRNLDTELGLPPVLPPLQRAPASRPRSGKNSARGGKHK
jgi:hypothetical protein